MARTVRAVSVTGPLFKWFGSKWSASKHYPAPRFDRVVEPYAGSAGYALRFGAGRRVIIAERDPHLRLLWRWLISEATAAQILEIPLDLPEGLDIRALGLNIGQATLLKTWQRTNNVGNCWTTSAWGSKPGQWTASTRARVAAEFSAVRSWILTDSAEDLFASPAAPATWFVDPPYQFNYRYKTAPLAYSTLGAQLASLPGEVIVCEARDPKTGLAPNWLPFVDFRRTVTSRRKAGNHTHSAELICVLGEERT